MPGLIGERHCVAGEARRVPGLVSPVLAAAIVLAVMVLGSWRSTPLDARIPLAHLGWEYGYIAAALVEGRGFADPFGAGTGATAWMPPLLAFWIAGIFTVLGTKTKAALVALMAVKCVGIAVAAGGLVHLLGESRYARYRLFLPLVFVCYAVANGRIFFHDYHDVWLTVLLSTAVLWMLVRLQQLSATGNGSGRRHWPIACLAALVPLTSPVLTFVLGIALLLLVRLRALRPSYWRSDQGRRVGVIILAVLASVGIWGMRNYVALERVIPVKSNLAFDFHQANVSSPTGLATSSLFMKNHPLNATPNRERYAREGEVAFLDAFEDTPRDVWTNDREGYRRRAATRARNAYLYMESESDQQPVQGELAAADAEVLIEADLMHRFDGHLYWISAMLSEDEFNGRLATLTLADPEAVLASWRVAERDWSAMRTSPRARVRGVVMALLPLSALLVALLRLRRHREPLLVAAAIVYVLFLVPYVLVSHYERYQVPLVGVFSILVFYAVASFLPARATDA